MGWTKQTNASDSWTTVTSASNNWVLDSMYDSSDRYDSSQSYDGDSVVIMWTKQIDATQEIECQIIQTQ